MNPIDTSVATAKTMPTHIARTQAHYTALVRLLRSNGAGWTGASPRAIGVTSCTRGEGVSTVAANMAVAAANVSAGPVLLVDANVKHASVAKTFRVQGEAGIMNALAGDRSPFECLVESPVSKLSLMLPGHVANDWEPAYDPASIDDLLDSLKHVFHLIVWDLPPADALTTCYAISARLDGVLLVVEAERVQRESVRRAVGQLTKLDAKVLGVVVNKLRRSVARKKK
jgi:capsular exopolysaccharide synthesis family protein